MSVNYLIGYCLVLSSFILVIAYITKISMTSDLRKRYELMNKYEIKSLRIASYIAIIGLSIVWIVSRNFETTSQIVGNIFLSMGSATICIVALHYFFKVYYPSFLEKRLKIIRYTPRISPKSGTKMELLHESEEDSYLDEDMLRDEEMHSIDYDVWIDKVTNFVVIEKYYGYQHAIECADCGYQTMYITKEEVGKQPSPAESGLLIKHYTCRYCNLRFHKEVVLHQASSVEASLLKNQN